MASLDPRGPSVVVPIDCTLELTAIAKQLERIADHLQSLVTEGIVISTDKDQPVQVKKVL